MGCGASAGPKQHLENCLARDGNDLSQALDQVKSTPDNAGVDPNVIKLAEEHVAAQQARQQAEALLPAAVEKKDIPKLEAAIETAVKADVDCSEARTRLAVLRRQQAASAKLSFIMEFKDIPALEKSIEECEEAGVENLANAKSRLEELEKSARQDLEHSASWYIGCLTAAIQNGKYAGLDEAYEMASAHIKLAELWEVEKAATIEELEAVVSTEDVAAIEAAIERGKRAGGLGEPQENAVARRHELLCAEAVTKLDSAIESDERSRLEEAIAYSEQVGLPPEEAALGCAQELLKKKIAREEATAKLTETYKATGLERTDLLSRAILEAELADVDEGMLEEARAMLVEWKKPIFLQAPSGDCQDGNWEMLSDSEQAKLKDLLEEYECSQGTSHNLDMGNGNFVNFNLMTICRPNDAAGEDQKFIMPLKQQDGSGNQVMPEVGGLHPWYLHLIEKKDNEREDDWLTNAWFWQAFSDSLRKQGHEVPETPHEFFDFRYNVDYRDWSGPPTENRGGVVYNFPTGWKRFAVRVKNRFGEDNSWLRLDGSEGEWAVAYHGTTYEALVPILEGGLMAGRAQVYEKKKDARTGNTIGRGIYCTPSMSVAQSYASSRQGEGCFQLDGKRALFVVTCRIKPSAIKRCQDEDKDSGAYWVINNQEDIRPYGVLVKEAPPK